MHDHSAIERKHPQRSIKHTTKPTHSHRYIYEVYGFSFTYLLGSGSLPHCLPSCACCRRCGCCCYGCCCSCCSCCSSSLEGQKEPAGYDPALPCCESSLQQLKARHDRSDDKSLEACGCACGRARKATGVGLARVCKAMQPCARTDSSRHTTSS